MSIGRIGTRAVVVGLGVLASLALTAAPSWAANEGNSANAKLCQPGGYPGVLFNQQGQGFKNAGACTKYAAKGGLIAGADVVTEPAVGGTFNETCSGFGLAPSIYETVCFAVYGNGAFETSGEKNAANGTASVSVTFPCTNEGSKVTGLGIVVFTTLGQDVELFPFPPPSGC
jgi:hypothetical protein